MSPSTLQGRINARQLELQQQGLLRQRKCRDVSSTTTTIIDAEQKRLVNFASNDYLGLSAAPALAEALYQGAKQFGVGSTASPLVCGYSSAHQQLEQDLCQITGDEAAILFSSGFAANTALLKTLFNEQDVVAADKLVHASMIDGLRDAKVKLKRFMHNDIDAAERLLQQSPAALLVESVYSMDGDKAPLTELYQRCQQYRCPLIVDDAHGFLLSNTLDIKPFARIITFGKTLGCQGAAIVGSQQLIDFLVANSREYIYSTALSPACCVAASKALQIALSGELQQRLEKNIRFFRQRANELQLALLASDTSIQPLLIGDSQRVLTVAEILQQRGFLVGAIRPPTVPKGSARLRITLSAKHSHQQIEQLLVAVAEVCHGGN